LLLSIVVQVVCVLILALPSGGSARVAHRCTWEYRVFHTSHWERVMDNSATAQSVHLDRIGQIALTVTDLARAKDFYQSTLGVKFLFDAGSMAFFQCGEIRLMIGSSSEPVAPDGTVLYFKVPDIHAAHATLSERGIVFASKPHLVAKMPDHDLWMAFLKDPDGHTLGLMSEVARQD
jgi:methylmalonyl-CoA/ethylmalonyl-CoA epimerase